MKNYLEKNALFQASHMMILVTYTALFAALSAETFLMKWETWALVPILAAVIFCWYAHIKGLFNDRQRLIMYVSFMMATIFFYGSHITSAFDMGLVMCVCIILCTTTGMKLLVNMCLVTYYVTFLYDLIYMIRNTPDEFDELVISRTALHLILMLVASALAKLVIDRWQQVLEHSQEDLEDLTEATDRLNDFLASVSHEIRTPINAVMGLSGICLERTGDEEQRRNLESIQGAGSRMTELISDILDYSDIDRNRIAVTPENYMLSSVLHDLAVQLRPYMKKGVELIIDVDPSIPAVMNTDVSKLKKIFWHLTSNALKFTKEGGVYVRITSEAKEYGINLLLDVFDTGIGMTEEEVDHLFEGFYQADSSRTRSSGGLGLGMAIVYGFVTALDGFIHMESKPGAGSVVHVCLPQKVVDSASCMSVRRREDLVIGGYLHFEKFPNPMVRDYYNIMVRNIVRGLGVRMHRVDNLENLKKLLETIQLTHLFVGAEEYESDIAYMERLAETVTVSIIADSGFRLPEGSKVHVMEKPFYCFPVAVVLNRDPDEVLSEKYMYCRGAKVLVVDDEPLNITVARDILSRYGMTVKTADSGQEAINICSQELFDIVFMDHMMPGMDGIEAMHRIRSGGSAEWKSLPIVALTANAGSTARETFRREGFDGFIPKPIDLAELERVLRALLPKALVTFEDTPRFKKSAAAKPTAPKGSAAPAAAPEDVYAPLRAAGVDISQGLRYCQNDDEFYRTLLLQFAAEAESKRGELEQFFTEGDLSNYSIRIHALKSTAKMIGADALSEKAKALEDASKAGRQDEVQAGHAPAMALYDALTGAIGEAFGGGASPDSAAADGDPDVLEFGPEEEV